MSTTCLSTSPVVLSTQTLRTLLPYQGSVPTDLYHNHHCLGFGLQLLLQKPMAMQTVQNLVQDILSSQSCPYNYSLIIHHHRYTQNNVAAYQYYLFASIQIGHNEALMQHRTKLRMCLNQQNIKSMDLHTTDFLIFLRTLMSPSLDNTSSTSLIDIHNKPFHDIIPSPGTIFTLASQHIDVISATSLGLFKKIRVIPNHIDPIFEEVSLWEPIHDMFQYSNCDWFMSLALTADPMHPILANFILITPPQHAYDDFLNISTHYTDYGLVLRPALSPLQTFLASLPFGFAESGIH